MENKEISKALKLLSQLMELHNENPFKIKSVASASFKVDKLPFKLKDKSLSELEQVEGIGKSTASKIWDLLQIGTIKELNTLISATPPGVLDMLNIKGLGPKKIIIIWQGLGIENVGELYYACNENRLIEAKGFGLKTQEEIKKAIEFKMASSGRSLYAKIEATALNYQQYFSSLIFKIDANSKVLITGEFRRKCEIIDELSFLICTSHFPEAIEHIRSSVDLNIQQDSENEISFKDANGISIKCYFTTAENLGSRLFETTGSEQHVSSIKAILGHSSFSSEEELYQSIDLNYIEPELREGYKEIELAKTHQLPILINFEDLKGALHNHSTWSDGVHTIEEMAIFCRDVLKLEYLGISDHSKTAVYASGLSIDKVLQQQEEIEHLNQKLSPFKIFKGIESDILSDGSLDYPEEILKRFDFVVASIHSNIKMDEEKATNRLLKAIENPYTTILGHPTGRLLLSRSGYPIDFKKVIDACASNHVAIEVNSNPLRLDLDWRWHQYALDKGVILAINPDAHRNEGFLDMRYGVNVARKGGLNKEKCLNSFNLAEISSYFENRKKSI